jgi:DNA mismatch repair protein MutS
MSSEKKLTPMMKQYMQLKKENLDALLLYRMGDFYESFYDDAKIISKVLGIALTKRGGEDATPLAGFPYHALDAHLPKLLKAGHKVARCEQVEDPKQAKGIVQRAVVEIVSPGSTFSEKLLNYNQNNFLVSLLIVKDKFGLAAADISTGEFVVSEGDIEYLNEVIQLYRPKEVLVAKSHKDEIKNVLSGSFSGLFSVEEAWFFDYQYAHDLLLDHFKTHSLKGFGCDELALAISASGALLKYLKENYKSGLEHITRIETTNLSSYMVLDSSTKRNLELHQTINDSDDDGTLLSVLDKTKTAMGARLLKKWLVQPLINKREIESRYSRLDSFLSDENKHNIVIKLLSEIGDIERLLGRISTGRCTPRDILFIKQGLHQIEPLVEQLLNISTDDWIEFVSKFEQLGDLLSHIDRAIHPEAPNSVTDGNIIKEGYNADLDELKKLSLEGKSFIANMQQKERTRTGITSLKINYNKVFGYYIDITNTHKDKVPVDYIRKQTLVNSERYITEELKVYEEKVLGAEDKIKTLEYELFQEIRQKITEKVLQVQTNARLIAEVDCLSSYAIASRKYNYFRPTLTEGTTFSYKRGRHPVVEQLLPPGQQFASNDIFMNLDSDQIMVITGPNMAGKSTYLRQTGLIVLMAQIGCFVPAEETEIGIVDRIFTRVGASDNLASGESTFLVEMNEAANILNNATPRSLILFDELGRGTSTFDGLSIAWSVVEYLHATRERAAKTLFATHYHELTELEMMYPRIKNYNIAVEEYDDQIIFLRKIVRGGTDHSYGIQVAKMAGLPLTVIERAKEILANLEENELSATTRKPRLAKRRSGRLVDANQLALFSVPEKKRESAVELAIKELALNNLTPLDALNKLNDFQKQLSKENV